MAKLSTLKLEGDSSRLSVNRLENVLVLFLNHSPSRLNPEILEGLPFFNGRVGVEYMADRWSVPSKLWSSRSLFFTPSMVVAFRSLSEFSENDLMLAVSLEKVRGLQSRGVPVSLEVSRVNVYRFVVPRTR